MKETKDKNDYQCDVCNRYFDDIYFGDWIKWCEDCRKEGKEIDYKKTYDNTFSPSLESGDFSMLSGETMEKMAEYLM